AVWRLRWNPRFARQLGHPDQPDSSLTSNPHTERSHMHRSRLAGFIIDCQGSDAQDAATFWSAALGLDSLGADGEHYVRLDAAARDLVVEVQSVSHPSRVHLDIEADDVDAEVKRLEQLGARRVE